MILLVVHHIVADFWSLAILVRELPALYREAAGGGPAQLPPPGLPYEEHVRLEREALAGERGEALLAYWQETLAGLPDAGAGDRPAASGGPDLPRRLPPAPAARRSSRRPCAPAAGRGTAPSS